MKKTIEICHCDLCKKEADIIAIKYPVEFLTEQTEGRNCKPYISYQDIDVCEECKSKILVVQGWGAQGFNNYIVKEVSE